MLELTPASGCSCDPRLRTRAGRTSPGGFRCSERCHDLPMNDFTVRGTVYQIGLPPRRIDLLTEVSGVPFDEAWSSRLGAKVGGVQLAFPGKEALIRTSSRPGATRISSMRSLSRASSGTSGWLVLRSSVPRDLSRRSHQRKTPPVFAPGASRVLSCGGPVCRHAYAEMASISSMLSDPCELRNVDGHPPAFAFERADSTTSFTASTKARTSGPSPR